MDAILSKKVLMKRPKKCPGCEEIMTQEDRNWIDEKFEEVHRRLDEHFVLRREFEPIRNWVYAVIGIMSITMLGALLALVIKIQ